MSQSLPNTLEIKMKDSNDPDSPDSQTTSMTRKKRPKKERSMVWDYFDKFKGMDNALKSRCKYCDKIYIYIFI